ncbi:MAG: class I SAM-dependent methyltransferase [Magnetococcales bacterium]|nr:class I SAM-dependent methyltransferase [Magnetococcales bacterium]
MSNINTERWNQNSLVMQESWLARGHRHRIVALSRLYALLPDRQAAILDVGCGSGFFLREFYAKGYRRLHAIEPDVALIANIPEGIAQVRNDRMESMGFADATFDALFVYGVLHHLKGVAAYAAACQELDRVLKPGGRIFIMEPGRLWMLRMVELATRMLGPISPPLRALREAFEEERVDQEFFIRNHVVIRDRLMDRRYQVDVDKYFLYSWVFTAQKRYE